MEGMCPKMKMGLSVLLWMQVCFQAYAVSYVDRRVEKSVEIAPGVMMPSVNLGGVHGKPSNYSLFMSLGGRGLDTALLYGDDVQIEVGKAVRSSGISREDIFVTTKVPCCPPIDSFYNITCQPDWWNTTANIARDLSLLGVGYIDLMLVHWPCKTKEQSLATYLEIEKMVQQGTARAVGVSNFKSDDLEYILNHSTIPPAVNQCQFSIGKHDDVTLQYCKAHNITYQAWSPLGGLSGVDVLNDPDVKNIANSHGVSAAQVALRWVLQAGSIFVTAALKKEYLQEDLSLFSFELTDDEFDLLASK
ncbi:hypothetical protein AAMO2058_001237800 [Amorphochlora amoebiformis]